MLSCQTGGDIEVNDAINGTDKYAGMKDDAPIIRAYVAAGGRYLGICMGGYLARQSETDEPGFDLLPRAVAPEEWFKTKGARNTKDNIVVSVKWGAKKYQMFYQEGPSFGRKSAPGAEVLGYYSNKEIAALVIPLEEGKVGVVGPHPEATEEWYNKYDLKDKDGIDADLADDLIEKLMK